MTDHHRLGELGRWLEAVCATLDLDPAVIDATTRPILDLVRQVAHGPSRPGAPLTAFLVGLAAAAQAGHADADALAGAVLERVATVERLLADSAKS